ncbi:DUF423 domain-containing protein [Cellvibrio fontiphilus]|uniref:DUF423 domain-containing protein n=1 Tax=Cellvibrio fontiphilus TaxID=1815559 RepID=A0ABV7FBH9_9GAMM
MSRRFIQIAAISGFIAVVIGAFAAHGLKQLLSPQAIETVKIGVQYQFFHTLALFGIALWIMHKPSAAGLKAAGLAFILGILLFSGSLYALALGAPRWLGPVTPLGGVCFLLGWLFVFSATLRTKMGE